jgi:uncharacterized protein YjbJ (UPF0337 family)
VTDSDKAKNKAQELRGRAQESVGRATGDTEMEAEGRANRTKGNLKQAGEKLKDAAKGLTGRK